MKIDSHTNSHGTSCHLGIKKREATLLVDARMSDFSFWVQIRPCSV